MCTIVCQKVPSQCQVLETKQSEGTMHNSDINFLNKVKVSCTIGNQDMFYTIPV